jgi:hypothetical protein
MYTSSAVYARSKKCRRLTGTLCQQQILQRTNTPNAAQKLQGLRTQTTDNLAGGPSSPNESSFEQVKAAGAEAARQMKDGESKDKK